MATKIQTETEKTTFFYQLREYGFARILKSTDFTLSIILFVGLYFDYLNHGDHFVRLGSNDTAMIIATSSAIFSIIIASVAIILSFSGTKFIAFLREAKQLHKILFLFWFCCLTHLTALVLAFFKTLENFDAPNAISSFYSALVFSVFFYAILQTFYAVGSIMRFAHFMDLYNRTVEKNDN